MRVEKISSIIFILFAILFTSCEKESEEYAKDKLKDAGITIEIKGVAGENSIRNSIALPVFNNYSNSEISVGEMKRRITAIRYSSEFQSRIICSLTFDNENKVESVYLTYQLSIVDNEKNKVINLHGSVDSSEMNISEFEYDEALNEVFFKFNIGIKDENQDLTIEGQADLEMYYLD